MTRASLLLLVLLATGCAHGRADRAATTRLGLDDASGFAIKAETDPLVGLDAYDATDLYERGLEAFDRGEYGIARALYLRVLEEFPESRLVVRAGWNLGLACERQGDFEAAVPHLRRYAELAEEPDDRSRANLHLASVLQRAARWPESEALLEGLVHDVSIDRMDRWEARALLARAWMETGGEAAAEDALVGLQSDIRRAARREQLAYPYHAAMVWHFAGELFRRRGIAVVVRDVNDLDAARERLQEKARHLLEARGHYKRALRFGVAEWSGPAALALGEIMEHFREALLDAEVPEGLEDDAVLVYRELVEERTRDFLAKAAEDYRWALRAREILALRPDAVQALERALERCDLELRAWAEEPSDEPELTRERPAERGRSTGARMPAPGR